MCNSALYLTVLVACLAACSARPADILARVPSNFYYGTKWVLFRDDKVPNPPPNVIQHENNVQVLPSYQYPQHQQSHQQQVPSYQYPQHQQSQQQQVLQGYVESVHVTPAPVHVVPTHIQTAAVVGDYESEVIESKFAQSTQAPVFKVTSYAVTSVPPTAVHVEGPAYYLRKKKNAQ